MSVQQPVPGPGSKQREGSEVEQVTGTERQLGPKRILLILLAVYAVLLALFNLKSVEINFVLFSATASLFVVITLAAAIGFLAGYLFDSLRARRRKA